MIMTGPDSELVPITQLDSTSLSTDEKIAILTRVIADIGAVIARVADGEHAGSAMRRCDTAVWLPGGIVAVRVPPG
jgi:hypothetical protein